MLYVAAFALGLAETVYDNAARAMLPRVVRRDQLERGNSLLTTAESVANLFLGAPLGAWLFALWAIVPLGAAVVLYAVAAVLIVTVGGAFTADQATDASLAADIREGIAWLRHHPVLWPLMWVSGVASFAGALVSGIGVLFVLDVLRIGETGFGVLLATAGVGAVLGALVSPHLTRILGRTNAMGVAGVGVGLAILVIGLVPITPVTFVAWPLSALAVSAFNVQIMSVRQALIPDALFGRRVREGSLSAPVPEAQTRSCRPQCMPLIFQDFKLRFRPAPGTTVNLCCPCLLYTSPSPRDGLLSRMPSSA